ncbi:hypothetical protein HaLaN_08904, partial [Haematococcus lacustris]
MFDKAPPSMSQAMQQLEKKHGKGDARQMQISVTW